MQQEHDPLGWQVSCTKEAALPEKQGGFARFTVRSLATARSDTDRNDWSVAMEYQNTIKLKDGRACAIRNATGNDAKAVYDNFNLTHGQTDFLLSYPDENSFDVEQEREFLVNKENSTNEIELCAVIDGRIVGTAGIEAVGKKDKVRHRAELGISIEKDHWKLGIGRALMTACMECAKRAGYLQLELDVAGENTRAIGLYKSLGFVEYGRNPKGFRSRTAGWQELVLMRLELGE